MIQALTTVYEFSYGAHVSTRAFGNSFFVALCGGIDLVIIACFIAQSYKPNRVPTASDTHIYHVLLGLFLLNAIFSFSYALAPKPSAVKWILFYIMGIWHVLMMFGMMQSVGGDYLIPLFIINAIVFIYTGLTIKRQLAQPGTRQA
jgi:predicted membrane channel-forming protein YqfA (hemolysin III family)